MSQSDDYPEGFTVEKTPDGDIIYRLEPEQEGTPRLGYREVFDEVAANNPEFAAMWRKQRRRRTS